MKWKLFVLMLLCVLLIPVNAHAKSNPIKKFSRGVINILTSPIEIPKKAREYWIKGAKKTDHILVWIGSGAVEGIIEMVRRQGSGAWDVISAPLQYPEDYEPLIKPDFVFEQWPINEESGR